jgi:hypothetical protein
MSERTTRLALLGVLAALTAGVAASVARRRRPGVLPGDRSVTDDRGEPRTFTCTCGEEYRTSGIGRHRVYWPIDAPDDEPVLGDECPQCGEPLPAEPTGATV